MTGIQLEVSEESINRVNERIGADILDLDINELIERRKGDITKYYKSQGILDIGILDVDAYSDENSTRNNIQAAINKYKTWFKKQFNIDPTIQDKVTNNDI